MVSQDSATKVHEILGISFDWPDLKIHPRSPGLSPSDRRYTSFYALCSNLGSRLLRFRDIAGFVSQMQLSHISLVFHPNFGNVLPRVRSMKQCSAVSQVPELIGRDVIFGEH